MSDRAAFASMEKKLARVRQRLDRMSAGSANVSIDVVAALLAVPVDMIHKLITSGILPAYEEDGVYQIIVPRSFANQSST